MHPQIICHIMVPVEVGCQCCRSLQIPAGYMHENGDFRFEKRME